MKAKLLSTSSCSNGDIVTVRVLEALLADVNTPAKDGRTPLHISSSKEKMEVVKSLVEECHVAINTTASDSSTPITAASEEIADYLTQQVYRNAVSKLLKSVNMKWLKKK